MDDYESIFLLTLDCVASKANINMHPLFFSQIN